MLVNNSFIVEACILESSLATLPMNIRLGLATPLQQSNSFFPLLTFKEQVHEERVDVANL
jgi:hypothetical protein